MRRIEVKGIVGTPIYALLTIIVVLIIIFSLMFYYIATKPRIGHVEFYLNGSMVSKIPLTNITEDGYAYYDAKKYGFLYVKVLSTSDTPIPNAYVHLSKCGLDNGGWTNSSGYARINITSLYLTPNQTEGRVIITIHAFGFMSETYWTTEIKVIREF